MKKLLLIICLMLPALSMLSQNISHIETTKYWYYIYDQDGKKFKTLSTNIGELQGYSSFIFIVKSGSWYNIYNDKGNKIKTLSVSYVGDVLSVTGETFTSRNGVWIRTWDRNGKIIRTRAAQH